MITWNMLGLILLGYFTSIIIGSFLTSMVGGAFALWLKERRDKNE